MAVLVNADLPLPPFLLPFDCPLLIFLSILPHCHKQKDADFSRQGVELVTHVTRLIELVIDFRNVPDDDYNKDNRMGCMFNLLVSGAGQGGVEEGQGGAGEGLEGEGWGREEWGWGREGVEGV